MLQCWIEGNKCFFSCSGYILAYMDQRMVGLCHQESTWQLLFYLLSSRTSRLFSPQKSFLFRHSSACTPAWGYSTPSAGLCLCFNFIRSLFTRFFSLSRSLFLTALHSSCPPLFTPVRYINSEHRLRILRYSGRFYFCYSGWFPSVLFSGWRCGLKTKIIISTIVFFFFYFLHIRNSFQQNLSSRQTWNQKSVYFTWWMHSGCLCWHDSLQLFKKSNPFQGGRQHFTICIKSIIWIKNIWTTDL